MKKIINGKKYDTSTAELIGSYSNDLPHNAPLSCEKAAAL